MRLLAGIEDQMHITALIQLNNTDYFIHNSESVGKKTLFHKALLMVLHLKKTVRFFQREKGYSYLISQRKSKPGGKKSPFNGLDWPSICSGLPPYSSFSKCLPTLIKL